MVKGYDSRVRLVSFNIDSNWTRVDMDKIGQVEELDDRMTKWDRDILDISNAPGALMFALLAIATYAVPVILDARQYLPPDRGYPCGRHTVSCSAAVVFRNTQEFLSREIFV